MAGTPGMPPVQRSRVATPGATAMRKHSQISARPLTFTFKIFSKPGKQFQWIKAPSSSGGTCRSCQCMTRVPRGLSARRFIRALEGDGFALQRVRGSHRIYRHADGRRVVVAYHALNDTFPIGTLRAMIADAGWQDDDLLRLGLIE